MEWDSRLLLPTTSARAGSLYPDASLGRHILLAPASVSGSASTRHITLDSSPAGLSSRSQLEGNSPPGLLGSGEGSPPDPGACTFLPWL